MTQDDLETVIARTGHERFRWLVSEANPDAESREGYRRHVADEAARLRGEPGPPDLPKPAVGFPELRNATRLGSKNCWFAEHDAGCGCNGLQCHLLGRRINIYDCVACLKTW